MPLSASIGSGASRAAFHAACKPSLSCSRPVNGPWSRLAACPSHPLETRPRVTPSSRLQLVPRPTLTLCDPRPDPNAAMSGKAVIRATQASRGRLGARSRGLAARLRGLIACPGASNRRAGGTAARRGAPGRRAPRPRRRPAPPPRAPAQTCARLPCRADVHQERPGQPRQPGQGDCHWPDHGRRPRLLVADVSRRRRMGAAVACAVSQPDSAWRPRRGLHLHLLVADGCFHGRQRRGPARPARPPAMSHGCRQGLGFAGCCWGCRACRPACCADALTVLLGRNVCSPQLPLGPGQEVGQLLQ